MYKIELGGGRKPRGDGFVNLDVCEGADVRCDFGRDPLPYPDDSVDEVYTSHTLEHVPRYQGLLHEIVRVCRPGARVEIRVPHWLQSMAHCTGHLHTISPTQVRHWTTDFIQDWFGGCKKRLKLLRTQMVPGEAFGEAKDLLGWFSDDQIMRLIPDACHEIRYFFEVVPNE